MVPGKGMKSVSKERRVEASKSMGKKMMWSSEDEPPVGTSSKFFNAFNGLDDLTKRLVADRFPASCTPKNHRQWDRVH